MRSSLRHFRGELRQPVRSIAALGLTMAAACAPEAPFFAQLELALAEVPEDVASLSVSVKNDELWVASATLSPGQTRVAFGVPAEVPLTIDVVARDDRPGPPLLGRMPSYAGSVHRTVPLRSVPDQVSVTAHPAGALTVLATPEAGALDEPVRVRLSAESGPGRPRELVVTESGSLEAAFALPIGRYQAEVVAESPRYQLLGTRGIAVLRGQETIFPLLFTPALPPLPGDAARRLELALEAEPSAFEAPDRLRTKALATTPFDLTITAQDSQGRPRPLRSVEVWWRARVSPGGRVTGAGGFTTGSLTELPARVALVAEGSARATLDVEVRQRRRPTLFSTLRFNLLAPGVEPASPARLATDLHEGPPLPAGAPLAVEVLDSAGLRVESFRGLADFSMSDPWVDLVDGPVGVIRPSNRGVLVRIIALPSGPRGVRAALQVTVTSTTTGLTLTATRALPAITELP